MTQKRGQLTKRIEEKSEELLGYKISQSELRLMAYIQYVMVNEQKLDRWKMNREEFEILSDWMGNGYVAIVGVEIEISKEFWDVICELIYLGYSETASDLGSLLFDEELKELKEILISEIEPIIRPILNRLNKLLRKLKLRRYINED